MHGRSGCQIHFKIVVSYAASPHVWCTQKQHYLSFVNIVVAGIYLFGL